VTPIVIANVVFFLMQVALLWFLRAQFLKRGRELISAYRQLRDAWSILQQCRETLAGRHDFDSKVIVERIALFSKTHGVPPQ